MEEEKIVWHSRTAPDGRELVTFGTPAWPIECYGPWNITHKEATKSIVPWHWHDELELSVPFSGDVNVMVTGKAWKIKCGQAVFVNSGVMHRTESIQGSEYYAIVFAPWIVGGEPGSVFWQKYLTPLIEATECAAVPLLGETQWEKEILADVQRIVQVWPQKPVGYEFIIRDALSHIVLLLVQNCLHNAPAPSEKALREAERIKSMLSFIQEHYMESTLTTGQIAASAAVSTSECLRCFHSMLNLTPKAYLRQYRIHQAAQQLAGTNKTVAQIGMECGFEDMSYFASVFRAELGAAPSEYRSTMQQAASET